MSGRVTSRRALVLGCAAGLVASLATAPNARAQATLAERGPVVEGEALVVTARGLVHADDGPLSAARHAARRRATERARELVASYVDRAIAPHAPTPSESEALHHAVVESLEELSRTSSADGSVRITFRVPFATLRAAFDRPGLPWSAR